MPSASLMRRAKDAMAKQKGLVPQRFVFSVRPSCLAGIPKGVKQVLLEWKGSGSKLSYTKVHPVNSEGLAVFEETLNMTTTLYKVGDSFEAKNYVLKAVEVQEVKKMGRTLDKTQTIAQYTLDFAPFTRLCFNPSAQEELEVQLRGPNGVSVMLHAFVKATYLTNWTPEDARSDLSFMTASATPVAMDDSLDYLDDDDFDQDLTGFRIGQDDDSPPGVSVTDGFGASKDSAKSTEFSQSGRLPSAASKLPSNDASPKKKRHSHHRSMDMSLATIDEAQHSKDENHARTNSTGRSTLRLDADQTGSAELRGDDLADRQQAEKVSRSQRLFSFMRRGSTQLRSASQPRLADSLESTNPAKLRQEAMEREAVDLRAEEDIAALRERAVTMLYARHAAQLKIDELKATLREKEARTQDSDDHIVEQLVNVKLQLAESDYKRLDLQLALHVERNRTRLLSAKMTQLGVERDLLANRVNC